MPNDFVFHQQLNEAKTENKRIVKQVSEDVARRVDHFMRTLIVEGKVLSSQRLWDHDSDSDSISINTVVKRYFQAFILPLSIAVCNTVLSIYGCIGRQEAMSKAETKDRDVAARLKRVLQVA